MQKNRFAILIPAYNPSQQLETMVKELSLNGDIESIIVVNDGSDEQYLPLLENIQQNHKLILLDHAINQGKGAALKTGINYVLCNLGRDKTIITADADGQHLVKDIIHVSKQHRYYPRSLMLGARNFDGKIPFRSWFGNTLTRWILYCICGLKLRDTQTGLRVIPANLTGSLLSLTTMNYDFELDMLLLARKMGINVIETPISTVYLDGNDSSHFNPILDSAKIYFVLLRFAFSSAITAICSLLSFSIFQYTFGVLVLSEFAFWIVGLLVQFSLNQHLVFHSENQIFFKLAKFTILVLFMAFLSLMLTVEINRRFDYGFIVSRIICSLFLYIPNFLIQRDLIFSNSRQ